MYFILPVEQYKRLVFYQNIGTLSVALGTLYLNYTEQYNTMLFTMFIYTLLDLSMVHKWDMFLHHGLVVTLCLSINHTIIPAYHPQLTAMGNVEFSSIFLTINSMIHKKYITVPSLLNSLNRGAFIVTFAKYRIWDLYWSLIYENKFSEYPLVKIMLYIFYSLNVYWFYLVLRKLKKMLSPS
jgi:hypothetical protein